MVCPTTIASTTRPASTNRCQHPRVDPCIFSWMPRRHLRSDALPGVRVFITGCPFAGDAGIEAERGYAIVAQVPDPSLRVPRPAGLLDLCARLDVGKGDTEGHDVVRRESNPRRLPIALGDDDLHGLQPLLPPSLVAIAHTDEAVAVLREELFGAPLAWLEMQPDGGLGDADERRGGVAGFGSRAAVGDPRRRASDHAAYVSGIAPRTLVMAQGAPSGPRA